MWTNNVRISVFVHSWHFVIMCRIHSRHFQLCQINKYCRIPYMKVSSRDYSSIYARTHENVNKYSVFAYSRRIDILMCGSSFTQARHATLPPFSQNALVRIFSQTSSPYLLIDKALNYIFLACRSLILKPCVPLSSILAFLMESPIYFFCILSTSSWLSSQHSKWGFPPDRYQPIQAKTQKDGHFSE